VIPKQYQQKILFFNLEIKEAIKMQRNGLLILLLGFLLGALTTGAIVGWYMAIQVHNEHAKVLELKMQADQNLKKAMEAEQFAIELQQIAKENLKAAEEKLKAAQQGNDGITDIFQGK
jgi:hypothetical protein